MVLNAVSTVLSPFWEWYNKRSWCYFAGLAVVDEEVAQLYTYIPLSWLLIIRIVLMCRMIGTYLNFETWKQNTCSLKQHLSVNL